MATTTYVAPKYEQKYKTQAAKLVGNTYDTLKKNYAKQANKERATQLGEAQKTQQSALKQAYVQRLQNQKALDQNLAMSGIRGGATETSNLKLANQYGTAVASANADYANSVNQINQSIDRNIFDYNLDMDSRKAEDIQNQANALWQARREDSLNQYNSAVEYWSNYYMDIYSGYSKKDAKKAAKKVEAKLKKAKSATEKMRLQQQLRGIRNRLGVIKNSK